MSIQIAKRIGRALGVRSGTRIKELDDGLREYVRLVPKAAGTPNTGSFDADQVTSGQFADARISETSVTQHQAALALAASQIVSGALAAVRGGTGQGSYAAGDVLYANSTTTLARLGIGSAGELLRVSGGAPAWQAPSTLSIGWSQLTGVPSTFTPANHLDTGNWTPADASGAGLTLTVSSARYFRHETLCLAMADIVYPATADGAAAVISGLPFTVAAGNANRQGFVSYHSSGLGQLFMIPNVGAATFNWYKPGGGTASNAELTGAQVFFCAVYGCVPP